MEVKLGKLNLSLTWIWLLYFSFSINFLCGSWMGSHVRTRLRPRTWPRSGVPAVLRSSLVCQRLEKKLLLLLLRSRNRLAWFWGSPWVSRVLFCGFVWKRVWVELICVFLWSELCSESFGLKSSMGCWDLGMPEAETLKMVKWNKTLIDILASCS